MNDKFNMDTIYIYIDIKHNMETLKNFKLILSDYLKL